MQKIMFNDRYGLTDAVFDGRKTMTRRIVPEELLEAYSDYDDYVHSVALRGIPSSRVYEKAFFLHRSRYKVGEEIAIAQKYSECVNDILTNWGHKTDIATLAFKELAGWANKMFVKAELMPHRIRITDIRIERLQDISDEDCLREGISTFNYPAGFDTYSFIEAKEPYYTPREAFAALIDKVSGKGTWESNPYVWVYSFELLK